MPVGAHDGRIGFLRGLVQVEAQQPALDRAIEERVLPIGTQAERAPEVRLAGEDARLPARKAVQQPLAEGRVQRLELPGVADAHAVGRIDQHQPGGVLRHGQLGDVPPFEQQVIAEAGAIGIGDRRTHRRLVAIAAGAAAAVEHIESTLGLGLAAQSRPQLGIVLPPAFEAEAAARQAGRDAGRDHRRLDHQRARSAHRVVERATLLRQRRPARAQQQCRRQVFLEWRLDARLPIAAAVQGLAAQVDPHGDPLAREAQADPQVRCGQVHRRPVARVLAHAVDDGVLGAQRRELRVPQPARRLADDIHGKRARGRHVRLPRQRQQAAVHEVRVAGVEVGQRQQHAARRARAQAGGVRAGQRAEEADAGRMLALDLDAVLPQLLRQQVRHIERTGGEESMPRERRAAVVVAGCFVAGRGLAHVRPPRPPNCSRSRGRRSCSARPMMR